MHNGCDVCHNFRPAANLRQRTLTPVPFGEVTVVLCEMHRRIALRSGVTTFEGLRWLYGESDGRRSYLARRARTPEVPATSERRQAGRRATDA